MRTTIAATATVLALLAGCGGGDSDTALAPGDSAAPTVDPSASASASTSASGKASGNAKPKKSASTGSEEDSEYDGPFWSSSEPATGADLPLTGALLPAHAQGAPYPASQLQPGYAGDVVLDCGGFRFPVDRLVRPRPVSDLSPGVKKAIKSYIGGIVAIADENHVLVLDPYPDNPESFDLAEVFFQTDSETGKHRWWTDTDYPPSSCSTTRALPDLKQVLWEMAVRPKPGDRSIQVAISGRDCNGKSATDRVKVAILGVAKDGIRLALGEELVPDGVTCPQPKRIVYTVELPEAIGDRSVIFAGGYPEAEAAAEYPTGEFAEPED